MESPDLVDRDEELRVLADAWTRACDGGAQVALLRADAGYGKSRLLRAVDAQGLTGGLVLHGSCVHAAGVGSPLLPFRAVLAELVDAWGRDRVAGLTVGAGALLDAIPTSATSQSLASPTLVASAEYDVLARVLDAASREEPIAILLEDLHWAAHEAWALLDLVARAMRTARILIVASMRVDPPLPSPTWELAHELSSLSQVVNIDLPALSPAGVRRQLRGILGQAPTEDLAERVATRSRGVPLLVEELAVAESAGDSSIPGRVSDVLAHRTRGMEPDVRSVLDAAAVAVGPVEAATLAEISGLSEHGVVTAVRALTDAGLLIVDPVTGAAEFRHALLREAAEGALMSSDRIRLHRAHAQRRDAAAANGDGASALAAAHHWARAGDVAVAWRATETAVAVAAAAGYRREEWRLLAQQLQWYDEALAAGAPVPDRVALMQRVGAAAGRCGEFEQGVQLLEEAWRSLDPRADAAQVLDVLADEMVSVHGDVAIPEDVERTALLALSALPPEPSLARLRGLDVLFALQSERRDFDASRVTIREAVACAEAIGDPMQASWRRLRAVVMLGFDGDNPALALRQFAETRAIAEAHNDTALVLWVAMNEADYLYILGRHQEGLARAREALALAQELPAVAEIYEYVIGNLAEALLATGQWAEGLDRLLGHVELDRRDIMRGVVYLQLAMFHLETDDRDAADAAYAAGRVPVEPGLDPQLPVLLGLVGAELALAHDQPREAVRLARDAFQAPPTTCRRCAPASCCTPQPAPPRT